MRLAIRGGGTQVEEDDDDDGSHHEGTRAHLHVKQVLIPNREQRRASAQPIAMERRPHGRLPMDVLTPLVTKTGVLGRTHGARVALGQDHIPIRVDRIHRATHEEHRRMHAHLGEEGRGGARGEGRGGARAVVTDACRRVAETRAPW